MKQENNKAKMNALIKKNSNTSKKLLSIPGVVLEPNTGGKLYDEAIVNRGIKAKLNSHIGKK